MSKALSYQPLLDIGLNGLNTQDNSTSLDPSYLTQAENIVLKESGRIALRKGFKQKVAPNSSAEPINSLIEHKDQGINKIFASHGTSIYTVDFTTPAGAFPSSGADVKHTVANSTGDWEYVNFNNRLHCVHAGMIPQRYDGSYPSGFKWSTYFNTTLINMAGHLSATATTITVDSTVGFPYNGYIIIGDEVIFYTGLTGTTFTGCTRGVNGTAAAPTNDEHQHLTLVETYGIPLDVKALFQPSCAMGYYGRLWCGGVAGKEDILYYSNLLDGDDFLNGDAGFISLRTVWGTDEIIAIAPFYGKLVIFGKNNIVIYSQPDRVTTVSAFSDSNFGLDEVIKGIGLVNRDSVQAIGDDLVFLSTTGLRSLARTTEKDKLPLTDLSINIKDTLIRHVGQSSNVTSVYVETEGIYILTFENLNITYVFDFKHITPNAAPRVTTWVFDNDREPASMAYTETYGLLVGQKDGSLAGYEGYYDKDLAGASTFTSASYTSKFSTIWIDLLGGGYVIASLLKRLFMVIEGGSGATLGLKWYKDYNPYPSTTTSILLNPTTTGIVNLFGSSTSLYGPITVTTTAAGSFVTGTFYSIASVGNTSFTSIGASANTVGVVFKATGAGSGNGTGVSHAHTTALHTAACTYAPLYGPKEYRTALTGSAKNLKISISIESNGYDASLQNMTLLHKQGKIR